MQFNYSLLNYLKVWRNFLISYLAIILIFAAFMSLDSGPLWSYIILLFACLVGLYLFSVLFFKKTKIPVFSIVSIAFLFKLFFGTWHFLTFVQPDYFSGNTSYSFFADYLWMHESIQYLASEAKDVGFLKAMTFDFFIENKGAVIFYGYSPIYYYGGEYVLNISHLNTVFTLFTAILIAYIANFFLKLNRKQVIATLILASFFPFGLIPSMTMRDFAGQFLIAMGLVSLQYAFKNPKLFLLLLIAGVLFFLQRKNYVVIPFIAYLIYLIFYSQKVGIRKFSNKFNIRLIFLLIFIAAGLRYYQAFSQAELINTSSQLNSEYTSDLTNPQFYILLPIYIFKGFMGPFPWSQFFNYTQETIFQLSDYFTSTFIFTMLVVLWKKRRDIRWFKNDMDVIIIASLLISFAGVASGFMHLSYISISLVFLIPYLMKYATLKFFLRNYIVVFLILVCMSVLWIAFGFYQGGSWSKFKN